MISLVTFLSYTVCAYGFCNMIIYANGPFGVFRKWREIAHRINDNFGELFTCPMCLSTWCGILFSLVNIIFMPSVAFTPFNQVFGVGNNVVLTVIMDMGATSGLVWLVHQFEEMMERVGTITYE